MVHGNGQIQVRRSYACGELRTEVHDDGGGRPTRRETSASDECGRGLTVIDGLIELYGGARGVADDDDSPGKTVHVAVPSPLTLRVPGEHAHRPPWPPVRP
jgi:two-component sensor histidine kinase